MSNNHPMIKWLRDLAAACWKPFHNLYARITGVDEECFRNDDAVWSRDIGNHSRGQFSYAVVQANRAMEDHSQVETHMNATYVGVYDGHGGSDEASLYVRDHLFNHIATRLVQPNCNTPQALMEAFAATENEFLDIVRPQIRYKPVVGSCCLVGIISEGRLHIANLGDSRAVLGRLDGRNRITAVQLTVDHNAKDAAIRNELWQKHQAEPDIVVEVHGKWRVKGLIQVTRSIGDVVLKQAVEPLKPALTAVPEINSRTLGRNDRFVIFASDGLWDYITNDAAVEIVNKPPRQGAAKRLLQKALAGATGKYQMRYRKLLKLNDAERRTFHDDITVIVLFIDHDLPEEYRTSVGAVSVKAYVDIDAVSAFETLARRNEDLVAHRVGEASTSASGVGEASTSASGGEGQSSRQNEDIHEGRKSI